MHANVYPGAGFSASPALDSWDWEELNAAFRPRLIAAGIARFGLTRDECEDAVQTVFLKVLTSAPRVRDARAYLRAGFLNQCQNIAETRARRRESEAELEDNALFEQSDAEADRIRKVSSVSGAFKQVGVKCQKVIKSYCVEELTLAETAERNGYSSKTIWKRVQECLKRMRLCLE
jgi:RNA polymerase sigma factor (sigma-70 family)